VGDVQNPVRDAHGRRVVLDVAPQGADLDPAFYDPRLLAGVDLIVTSSAVRGRFEGDPGRFPAPNHFYALLDRTAEIAARFGSHGDVTGPSIEVYRLTAHTRAAVDSLGALDPLWWTAVIPPAYREHAQSVVAPDAPPTLAPRLADGMPAPWVVSLAPLFEARFAPFAVTMTIEHEAHGHPALASRFAIALLAVTPDNLGAYLSLAQSATERNAWAEAAPWLERGYAALSQRTLPAEARQAVETAIGRARAASSQSSRAPSGTEPARR
jgi:hypothetical protein